LLGRLKRGVGQSHETRLRNWYLLVGSAIEHAASTCVKTPAWWDGERPAIDVSFKELFKTGEAEAEAKDVDVAVIQVLYSIWQAQQRT
jgi:hypothetical protein